MQAGRGLNSIARITNENAFTLIELLVAITVAGLILLAAFNLYRPLAGGWASSINRLENSQTARIAMETVISELLFAEKAEIRQSNSSILYYYREHQGNITLFRFRHTGEQLFIEQRTLNNHHRSTNVVANGISEFAAEVDDDGIVLITLTAGRPGENREAKKLVSAVWPRNSAPAEAAEKGIE